MTDDIGKRVIALGAEMDEHRKHEIINCMVGKGTYGWMPMIQNIIVD